MTDEGCDKNECFRCSSIVIEKTEFRYDIIPPKGTVFGILLDGVVVRAVRENLLKVK